MDYGVVDIVWRLLAGLGLGFLVGLTGIGGGVLGMPLVTLGFGLPGTVAVGTCSTYLMLSNIYGVYAHWRLRTVCWRASALLLAGAVPANLATSWAITRFVRGLTDPVALARFQGHLKLLIALVMVAMVVLLTFEYLRNRGRASANGFDAAAGHGLDMSAWSWRRKAGGVLLGAVFGVVIGATSIGGGAMIYPMLTLYFGLGAHVTVGSSILVAVVVNIATSAVYLLGGQVDVGTAVLMVLGSGAGVWLGSRLSVRLPERRLKGIVIILIAVATAGMFAKGLRPVAPAPAPAAPAVPGPAVPASAVHD